MRRKWLSSHKQEIFIFSGLFVAFLIYGHFSVLTADDYATYNLAWLETTSFEWQRMFAQISSLYMGQTGRILSSFCVFFFSFFSKNIFDIFNATVFLMFIFLLWRISKPKKGFISPTMHLVLVLFSVVLFTPSFAQVFLWKTGAPIYHWMMTLMLALLYPYAELAKGVDKSHNLLFAASLFFLGVFAGNGLETNSLMLLIVLFCFVGLSWLHKTKLPAWCYTGLIGTLAGTISNVVAPGNFARQSLMTDVQQPLFEKLYDAFYTVFYRGFVLSKLYILVLIFCSLLILLYLYTLKQTSDAALTPKRCLFMAFWGGLALLFFIPSLLANLFIPTVEDMAAFYYTMVLPETFLCIVLIVGLYLIGGLVFCFWQRKHLFCFLNTNRFLFLILPFGAALLGVLSYVMAPLARERSFSGMTTFLLIGIVYMFCSINYASLGKNIHRFAHGVIVLISTLAIILLCCGFLDSIKATQWQKEADALIYAEIAAGTNKILVPTYLSENPYSTASIELWTIPAIIEDERFKSESGVHIYYEWINIAITNYYFDDPAAWQKGKRIIGVM